MTNRFCRYYNYSNIDKVGQVYKVHADRQNIYIFQFPHLSAKTRNEARSKAILSPSQSSGTTPSPRVYNIMHV